MDTSNSNVRFVNDRTVTVPLRDILRGGIRIPLSDTSGRVREEILGWVIDEWKPRLKYMGFPNSVTRAIYESFSPGDDFTDASGRNVFSLDPERAAVVDGSGDLVHSECRCLILATTKFLPDTAISDNPRAVDYNRKLLAISDGGRFIFINLSVSSLRARYSAWNYVATWAEPYEVSEAILAKPMVLADVIGALSRQAQKLIGQKEEHITGLVKSINFCDGIASRLR